MHRSPPTGHTVGEVMKMAKKKKEPMPPLAPATPEVPDPPVPNRARSEMLGDPPAEGEKCDPCPECDKHPRS